MSFALSFFFIKFATYGVYYWIPTYLQEHIGYSKNASIQIYSLQSVGGIIGSITLGFLTDLMTIRSPIQLIGCTVGACMLFLVTSVQTDSQTALLTFYLTTFTFFETGAMTLIGIIQCDIGKD